MAYCDIQPVKKTSIIGCDFIPCEEEQADHWLIEVGFDGGDGFIILPSRKAADACFASFVLPYERGII